MKAEQKFKLVKWNKQLISVATGMLLVGQIGFGTLPAFAETTESAVDQTQVLENPLMENQDILDDAAAVPEQTVSNSSTAASAPQAKSENRVEAVNQQSEDIFEWTVSNGIAKITGLKAGISLEGRDLLIPASYDGMPVQINFAEVFGDHTTGNSKLFQLAKFEIEDSGGDTPVKILDENLRGLFGLYDGIFPNNSQNIRSVKFGNADIEKVTSMEGLFIDCINLETIDLTGVDTKNVTNMSYMFYNASRLETLDLSKFNTAKVTNMMEMFYNASGLKNLELTEKFDTTNVTNMSYMFSGASSLKNLELTEKFNTAKVTNMSYMFSGARSLATLDLSKFNTANVEDMRWMFYNAGSLEKLDLSNFNTSNVEYMDSMFDGANALTELKLSNKFEFKSGHSLREHGSQRWISDTEIFQNVSALIEAQNTLAKDTNLPPVTYRIVAEPVTITFEAQKYPLAGVTFEPTQRVIGAGESIADPKVTSNDGNYIITEWENDNKEIINFEEETFDVNTTLTPTAHRKRQYTIYLYRDEEDSNPVVKTVDFDAVTDLTGYYTKENYRLIGWEDDYGNSHSPDINYSNHDLEDGARVNFYAQWKLSDKTLKASDLNVTLPQNVTYDGLSHRASIETVVPEYQAEFDQYATITYEDEITGETVTPRNAGDYLVKVKVSGGDLLQATEFIAGKFTIAKKPATATINPVSITQGDVLPTLGITYAGFVPTETARTIFSTPPKAKYTVNDSQMAGESPIIFEIKGIQKVENYAITYNEGTLTITEKAVTPEPTPEPEPEPEPEEDRLPLYRVYNPNNGEHLYTLDQAEAQGLIEKGWLDEGIGWYGGKTNGKAVYRLYNQNSGEHFYTLDAGEYETVASAGWTKEGVAFYAAEDTEIPIYRVFNPNSQDAGSHHYTLSSAENSWLISEGWRAEGTAFYGK